MYMQWLSKVNKFNYEENQTKLKYGAKSFVAYRFRRYEQNFLTIYTRFIEYFAHLTSRIWQLTP